MNIDSIKQNHFIYKENEVIGSVLIVETSPDTCEIHKVKAEEEGVFVINAPWWDLDSINREVKANEKEIDKALRTHRLGSCMDKVTELHKEFEVLTDEGKEKVLNLIKETFNI